MEHNRIMSECVRDCLRFSITDTGDYRWLVDHWVDRPAMTEGQVAIVLETLEELWHSEPGRANPAKIDGSAGARRGGDHAPK